MKIGTAILIFTFIKNSEDLWTYTLIMSVSAFVSNIFFITQLRGKIVFSKVNLGRALKKHFKNVLLLFVPQIGITLFKDK